MPESVLRLGEVGSHLPTEPWLLVFGGVTREGNRRARRATEAALRSGMSVLWFDGFGEQMAGAETDRVPLDAPTEDGRLLVIDYTREEQNHWLYRTVREVPGAMVVPIEKLEAKLPRQRRSHLPLLTRLRRLLQRMVGALQKKVLGRLAQIFRGRVGWNLVKDDVAVLAASAPAPTQIVYGDDHALTQGWRAAKIWPEVATAMEFIST